MGASIKHRFKFEGVYPFWNMAFLANSQGRLFDVFWITRFDMQAAWSMTHLAPRILEFRGGLHGYKTAGFPVSGCVAFQTTLIFGFRQTFFHDLNMLKGTDFGSVCDKIIVLLLMT